MGLTVLIVDDSEAVRFFHKIVVTQSKLSAEPLMFGTSQEALTYLDQHSDEKNTYLILLDINMPVMNGWDLMNAIDHKNYKSRFHIVMVTSSVATADHEKSKLYGMVIDFVEKPISPEECEKIMHMSPIAPYFEPSF
ncbi:MAG: response regulator [Ferruginibacter sp.]